MPSKIVAVIIVMILSVILNLSGALDAGEVDGTTWVGIIIQGLLILGLLKGSEGVRMIVIIFATIGVFFGGIGIILAMGTIGLTLLTAGLIVSTAANMFVLYALQAPEVKQWMFERSVGGRAAD